MFRKKIGMWFNEWIFIADLKGANHPDCRLPAEMYSRALDAEKSGEEVSSFRAQCIGLLCLMSQSISVSFYALRRHILQIVIEYSFPETRYDPQTDVAL